MKNLKGVCGRNDCKWRTSIWYYFYMDNKSVYEKKNGLNEIASGFATPGKVAIYTGIASSIGAGLLIGLKI